MSPAARQTALLGALLLCGACIDASVGPAPAVCGNGLLDPGERCDPGLPEAKCSAECVPLTCGDGVVSLPFEECDPAAGDDTPADCDAASCQWIVCGNARIDAGEGCDLGAARNGVRGELCLASCQLATCGDGRVEGGEACDDGDRNDDRFGACREDCTAARCGDGELGPGETCDGGEGCTETCELQGCRAVEVAAGYWSSYVRVADGRVYGFGAAAEGALPVEAGLAEDACVVKGKPKRCRVSPTLLALPSLAAIAGGTNGGVGLLADRSGIVTWGYDDRGQRGDGALGGEGAPTVIAREALDPAGTLGRLRGVAIGRDVTLAFDDRGHVVGAGSDATGSLQGAIGATKLPCGEGGGLTTTDEDKTACVPAHVAVHPPEGSEALPLAQVLAGRGHVVVLGEDGVVRGWGETMHGQIAAFATALTSCEDFWSYRSYPSPQVVEDEVWQLAVTGFSTLWLDRERRLHGVGSRCYAELGSPASEPTVTPQLVELEEDGVTAAKLRHVAGSSSYVFGLAIADDDALWGFGQPLRGANGRDPSLDPARADRPHRFTIPAAARPVDASLGRGQALVRLEDGTVWALGGNEYGQLGQGTSDELVHATPVRVHLPCEGE